MKKDKFKKWFEGAFEYYLEKAESIGCTIEVTSKGKNTRVYTMKLYVKKADKYDAVIIR